MGQGRRAWDNGFDANNLRDPKEHRQAENRRLSSNYATFLIFGWELANAG
jgi:hypothetical protein